MPDSLCPLCGRGEVIQVEVEPDLQALIQTNAPGWLPEHSVCQECLTLFRGARDRLQAYPQIFDQNGYRILPTPLRVGAEERFRGRGVTIAFLDSGFYPHPDLTEPRHRIRRYINITDPSDSQSEFHDPNDSSWHGMMTSVVAAGSGHLSGGMYRGLASEAEVVLVKVGSAQRILHDDIRRGIEWVIEHRAEYNIGIINISCAGDYEASFLTDGLSQAAEQAVQQGMVVVCAAGNAGNAEDHAVLPPGSAPSVITVGGFNDKNQPAWSDVAAYHSSYGPTIDGLQKPEVIAPSIWIAAPILPGTPTAAKAQLYRLLHEAPDDLLRDRLKGHTGIDTELDAAAELPLYLIRHLVAIKLHDANVISGHYKHVDGTSFAAPIVSSVVAQMLEANPRLTPPQIKRILLDTAVRLDGVSHERQGCGTVVPGRAVEEALGFGF